MKLEFYYAHYTRDFRKREVLVEKGTLAMEFREGDFYFDTEVDSQMRNIFIRVLRRFDMILSEKASQYKPFGSCGFILTSEYDDPEVIWEKELGKEGEGDLIRITSTFPPEILKRYQQEWDDYMDDLSMPEA